MRFMAIYRLGGALRDFQFYYENTCFFDLGPYVGFGSMENTPTGCGSDLYTILRILSMTENREV